MIFVIAFLLLSSCPSHSVFVECSLELAQRPDGKRMLWDISERVETVRSASVSSLCVLVCLFAVVICVVVLVSDVALCCVQVMFREKKMFPNLDFYAASAYHQVCVPQKLDV